MEFATREIVRETPSRNNNVIGPCSSCLDFEISLYPVSLVHYQYIRRPHVLLLRSEIETKMAAKLDDIDLSFIDEMYVPDGSFLDGQYDWQVMSNTSTNSVFLNLPHCTYSLTP